MRHLLALVLLSIITLLPSCKFIKEKGWFGAGKKARQFEMLKARQDSIRVTDSLKRIENRLRALEQARIDSIRLAEEEKQSWENRYKYNLIVGSFLTPEYARDWAEEYLKMGYSETRIIKMEGTGFELVSAEAYENYNRAISRLHQYLDTVNIDTWLYILR
ncbi:MAG: hypothetical protein R6W81_08105 [Bacteroidales bacterium]